MSDKKADSSERMFLTSKDFGSYSDGEVDITLSNHRPRMLINHSIFSSSSEKKRDRHAHVEPEPKSKCCCFPFRK